MLPAALRTLNRLKWRAWWRRLGRRLRTPAGALVGIFGGLLLGLWAWSLFWRARLSAGQRIEDPLEARGMAAASLFFFGVMLLASAFGHRGLYFPRSELERLLSAPLTRAQLVRYRLCSTLTRSTVFSGILGLVFAPRMPVPLFGFLGTLLAMSTLPILGQGAAILMGDAENRLGRLVARVPRTAVRLTAAFGLWAMVMLLVLGEDLLAQDDLASGRWMDNPGELLVSITRQPVVQALSLPAYPWARAMAAPDLGSFLPWILIATACSLLLFEGVARIPIDFRLLSLETSQEVARRWSRIGSGRGTVNGLEVSKRSRGLRVPWFFGRSPFGAVAWLQCVALRRKARGALLFALFTTGFTLLLTVVAISDPFEGSLFLGLFGVIYLASGLRFDFRGNLDGIEATRAWPLSARAVFLGTILPEVVIVSALMITAQIARLAWIGAWDPRVLIVILATPPATLLWLALDNAVFLLAPVRFEPGQASAIHHAGRIMLTTLTKLLSLVVTLLAVTLGGLLTAQLLQAAGASALLAAIAGITSAVVLFGLALALVIVLGGWTLGRFDVANVQARVG